MIVGFLIGFIAGFSRSVFRNDNISNLLNCELSGLGSLATPTLNAHFKSTSAKPVMTKLQKLFVLLVNMDIFQMTLTVYSLFTNKCNFC